MAHYTKIHHQFKTRSHYNLQQYRTDSLKRILNRPIYRKPQIRRFKNYCQVSSTAKAYYGQFALSRHCLRNYANFGYVMGLSKSSW